MIVYVGGPRNGRRDTRQGSGRWPTYRTEQGESMPAERGDQLARTGTFGFYRIAEPNSARARRIDPKDGRVYVHSTLLGRKGRTR